MPDTPQKLAQMIRIEMGRLTSAKNAADDAHAAAQYRLDGIAALKSALLAGTHPVPAWLDNQAERARTALRAAEFDAALAQRALASLGMTLDAILADSDDDVPDAILIDDGDAAPRQTACHERTL